MKVGVTDKLGHAWVSVHGVWVVEVHGNFLLNAVELHDTVVCAIKSEVCNGIRMDIVALVTNNLGCFRCDCN